MRHDAYTCPPPTHAYISACINVQAFTKAYISQSDWQLFSDCVALCSSVLQLWCSVLQLWCSVLQCLLTSAQGRPTRTNQPVRPSTISECVAVCCSVVQCVAVCGSVLQCVAAHKPIRPSTIFRVCCGVVLCVAMCCNVLQFVRVFAVCCSTPTYLTFV